MTTSHLDEALKCKLTNIQDQEALEGIFKINLIKLSFDKF